MFTTERIAIEKLDGSIVAERRHPRDSFASHQMNTAWDALHRAYVNGEAYGLVQDFFFDENLGLRRHDYGVNIAGGFGAAQLTSDYVVAMTKEGSLRSPSGSDDQER